MTSMRAVVASDRGGPEVLRLENVPLGWRRSGSKLLIRLKAASVNPADVWFRSLGPYVTSNAPLILGIDGAGIVEAVGPRATRFKPGDRVCFCHGGIGADPGTYAEFAIVPEDVVAEIPAGVDFHRAAALPLVAITAWEAIYDRAQVKPGEHVLVHAGAGGTGHLAVQLARLAGARVAATVSGPDKATFVRRLGAARAIDYGREDFVESVLVWTKRRGLDVALDNVGAEVLQRTYRAMAAYGRIVTLMGTPGDDADTTAYNRNLTLHNLMMLTPMWLGLGDRLAAQGAILRRAVSLLADGKIDVHVAGLYPLAEIAAAHARIEAGGMVGKLVIDIAG
jgi:NADPH:quinone reductase